MLPANRFIPAVYKRRGVHLFYMDILSSPEAEMEKNHPDMTARRRERALLMTVCVEY